MQVPYKNETYSISLVRGKLTKPDMERLTLLSDTESYFYGGMIDLGTKQHLFFGTGMHMTFEKAMRLSVPKYDGDMSDCQINVDIVNGESRITGALFMVDPGSAHAYSMISDVIARREQRIHTILDAIPDECYNNPSVIHVGWFGSSIQYINEYLYSPTKRMLVKNIQPPAVSIP